MVLEHKEKECAMENKVSTGVKNAGGSGQKAQGSGQDKIV